MGCIIKRILQFDEALNFYEIQVFGEGRDITLECMYSWSSDGVCWTNWAPYTTYLNTCQYIESDFYLRILLFGGLDRVYVNNNLTTCYHICIDSTNPFLTDFCGQSNLFQPYNNLDCALLLQQQMSDSIICMFGIPVYYLRVMPNAESVDYTFKEYSLHDVVDIKQIKMMIPDGTMPSSNPKLTDFDFDWESDWEVEIGKNQFAKAFGDTAFPKQRDLVYVPLMKRLWEVNSAYDEKNEGLLWRPTTWKLAMVKYNEKTNVDQGMFESLIDNWTVNTYENTFEERENNEQERLTGSKQVDSPRIAHNNLYNISMSDAVRKYISINDINQHTTQISDYQYYHRNAIVGRNIYTFVNPDSKVIYQKGLCGDAGTISFILNTGKDMETLEQKPILEFGGVVVELTGNGNSYNLSFGDLTATGLQSESAYMVIIRWNSNNFSSELNVYPYVCDNNVPVYLRKPEMFFFDYEHPLVELTSAYNTEYRSETPQECSISGYPVHISNVKYYNTYLDIIDAIKESTKYTTTHENCIINDLARPIESGLGFDVK